MSARDRRSALAGMECDHAAMAECCDGCGHYTCPDCGLYWDEGAWGGGPFDTTPAERDDTKEG